MASDSYNRIVKSSVLIGGASVINVFLGVVRIKALALLLGTSGMGLYSAFSSIIILMSGVAGMGLGISGVRKIAEGASDNDHTKVGRTAKTINSASIALGFLGMLGLVAFCRPISLATFGSHEQAGALALLSVTLLFSTVSSGQVALVRGMRRISDLSALSIWSGVLGTAFSIPIIYIFREKGIVPFLIIISAGSLLASWTYARKVKIEKVLLPMSSAWIELRGLVGLGVAFMAVGLMTNIVAYLTRVIVIRQMNIEAAGLFQAAWTLSGVYVGFILVAMGADYYPRLTSIAKDNKAVNQLVNEQSEAALLMAAPGILAMLAFAPVVIHLLYSSQFLGAVEILRWQTLGVLGRVISWPLGFVLMARGNGKTFFLIELASNILHLLFIWWGLKWFGLRGIGMAFMGLYAVYSIAVLLTVRRITGFRWSFEYTNLLKLVLIMTLVAFCSTEGFIDANWGLAIGTAATLGMGVYSVYRLADQMGRGYRFWNRFPFVKNMRKRI